MKNKKLILSIGSMVSIAAPVATIISCGTIESRAENNRNWQLLESVSSMRKVEEQWWKLILHEQFNTYEDHQDIWSIDEIKEMSWFVAKRNIERDASYLRNLANKWKTSRKLEAELNQTLDNTYKLAKDWGLLQFIDKNSLSYTTGPIANVKEDAMRFLFANEENFRRDVIKKVIASKYLIDSKSITKDEYKEIFIDKDFTDKQKIMDENDFVFVNQAVRQHLFAQWNVTLDFQESAIIHETKDPTDIASAFNMIKSGGAIYDGAKFTMKQSKLQDGILNVDEADISNIIGYSGINPFSDKEGQMKLDLKGLKLATKPESWNGFVFEGKITRENIKLFPDKSPTVLMKFVHGLMPIYKDSKLTFETTKYESDENRKKLSLLLSENASVYEEMKKYYTKRKTDPILLNIDSPDLKKVAIEFGHSFIKTD